MKRTMTTWFASIDDRGGTCRPVIHPQLSRCHHHAEQSRCFRMLLAPSSIKCCLFSPSFRLSLFDRFMVEVSWRGMPSLSSEAPSTGRSGRSTQQRPQRSTRGVSFMHECPPIWRGRGPGRTTDTHVIRPRNNAFNVRELCMLELTTRAYEKTD